MVKNEVFEMLSQVEDISNTLLNDYENDTITLELIGGTIPVYVQTIDILKQLVPKQLYVTYEEFFYSFYDFCVKCSNIEFIRANVDTLFSSISLFLECMESLKEEWNLNIKTCACCGQEVIYSPLPGYYSEMKEKAKVSHVTKSETLNSKEYLCPSCMCSDRDRMMVSFMEKEGIKEAPKNVRILQFAPAQPISKWITNNVPQAFYDTTDLFMDGVSFKSDIQNMDMIDDETYDILICSHVLEHVQDDRKAMAEMKRIMKSDGKLIFLVPIDLNVEQIDEEWGLSEEENWRRFGQGDHCRRYSQNGLVERLEEFYCVHQLTKEYFGEEIFRECGLTDTSTLYVCTKSEDVSLSLKADCAECKCDTNEDRKTSGDRFDSVDDLINIVRESILFDAEWYRQEYQIPEQIDVAEHYVTIGWKKGYDPSVHFSTWEYFDRYPKVYKDEICPLLHYEAFGLYENRKVNIYYADVLREKHPECLTDLSGGIMRLRITNRCPGRCRYCGQLAWSEAEQQREMNSEWYFEYCKPLYDKLNMILITGGDAFSAKESYNYMKFLSDNYPHITIATETNGMPFNAKFQELAAENLFTSHISLNASNAEVYGKGCWAGKNATSVYEHIMTNIRNYTQLLETKGLLCFAPFYSMVVNKDTADDVYDFVKLSLELKATKISFLFDYMETNMGGEYFGCPETSRRALQTMVEIERVLAKKVSVGFRLWLPSKELAPIQEKVNKMDIALLREKYADIIELAKDRNMLKEFEERNRIRKERGKRELSFEEDFSPTLRMDDICGQRLCASPWKMIDLYPTGRLDFCGWFQRTLNFYNYIEDGAPDWNEILNSPAYMMYRSHILKGDYTGCMTCCPLNNCNTPIMDLFQYGFNREEE